MAPLPDPLVAMRFVPLPDGTWRDLATGGAVWLVRRTAIEVVRTGWPEQVSRAWQLWHPYLAPCVDFGWLGEAEWFDAFAIEHRKRTEIDRPSRAMLAGLAAFLDAHDVACALEQPWPMADAAMPRPRDETEDTGGREPSRDGRAARHESVADAEFGLRLLPRTAERRVISSLDEPLGSGPRVWRLDAPAGCGWHTSWRRIAREARLKGFVPISSSLIEGRVQVPGAEGRAPSWLSALGAARLLVAAETADWQTTARQDVARLLVRLGGAAATAIVFLDVVRCGRPSRGDIRVEPIEPHALVSALWIGRAARSRWSPSTALRAAKDGLPKPFVAEVQRMLAGGPRTPMVHERAARFAAEEDDRAPSVWVEQAVRQARVLERRGRGAAAERLLRGAEGAARRRGERAGAAILLGRLALLAAGRGDIARSQEYWDAAAGTSPPASVGRVARIAVALADAWMCQAAFREAERLLRALRASASVAGDRDLLGDAVGALATCLSWQARWSDALNEASALDDDPRVRLGRVWARIALGDLDGAAQDLAAARDAPDVSPGVDMGILAARLRLDIAAGAIDRLEAAVAAGAGARAAHRVTLADVDLVLLPLEGLVRHRRPLTEAARALAARYAARVRPRLCRARARLALALDLARSHGAGHLDLEMTRVVAATGAGALAPGSPLSPWPPRPKEPAIMLDEIVALLRICHDCEDAGVALSRACVRLRDRLECSVVGVAAAIEDGEPVIVAATGRADLVNIARRAIELQQQVEPEGPHPSYAVPVTIGGQVIGAIACAWQLPDARPAPPATTWLAAAAVALAPTVRLAGETAQQRRHASAPDSALLGTSLAIVRLRAAIEAAARVPFTVLIEGESGSGKELVAREVHRRGPRRTRAFCAINCAALTDELCEAELFGHARGAFTGAVGERAGLFEEADGGTLFLDEVSELSPRAQAKLLRAIQEGEVRRLGETRARRVDVRVVAATNRPLADAVAAGAFRADLRYRLDVVHIAVPPLRERPEDIAMLARHFWQRASERAGSRATLSATTLASLTRYDWPGNVRELQNVLAALAVNAPRHGAVHPSALPLAVVRRMPVAETLEQIRRQADERAVRMALAHAGGHRGRAAQALGVTRQGLAKLVGRLQIDAPQRSASRP